MRDQGTRSSRTETVWSGSCTIWSGPWIHLVFNVFSILSHYSNTSGKMGRRQQKTNTAAGNTTTVWNCCYVSSALLPPAGGLEHDSTWTLCLVCGRALPSRNVTCTFLYIKDIVFIEICSGDIPYTVSCVVMTSLLTSVPVRSNSSLVISTTRDSVMIFLIVDTPCH